MISDIQLKANKHNAQLGGVKTPKGIQVSKYNAQTHGVLRNSVTEYETDFYHDILDNLINEYQPQGVMENILLERIALCYLKLCRLQKAETEFMKSNLDPTLIMNYDDVGISEVTRQGYKPVLTDENVQKLSEIYARYETTIENRMFRIMHELERIQRMKKGEKISAPISADVNQMGSFGETSNNI